jgi:hypothetical protein
MSTPVADGTKLEGCAVTQQNVKTGQKVLQKWPDKPERCRMFRMQTIWKDNRHITVTEVASQFAISIRQVQLTVHHDPELKKVFAHGVCYEELCEEHNFIVRKPARNIQTNTDTSLLTTEQETVHGIDNSYTSKTEGILSQTICQ